MTAKLTNAQIAWRAAQDIADGAYVNLGIGFPEMVAKFKPEGREVIYHTENGILDFGEAPPAGEEDWDLINAGKKAVTLNPGAAFFHHADSFAMVRGGHLDVAILGAYEVAENGDLANWSTGSGLGAGGRRRDGPRAWRQAASAVITDHVTKNGEPKLVEALPPAADRRRLRDHGLYQPRRHRHRRQAFRAAREAAGHEPGGTAGRDRRRSSSSRAPSTISSYRRFEHDRSLYLRLYPHAHRPLRRLAFLGARRRSRRHAAEGADGAQRRRRLGGRRRRRLWLRQPGRRGQPQRRAHVAAAGRPAGSRSGHDGQPALRLGHGCASIIAARAIKAGEAELMIAGGVEIMSRAPFVMPKADTAFSRNAEIYDTTIGWRFVNPLMKKQYGVDSMPETGENVAEEFQRHPRRPGRLRRAQPGQGGRRAGERPAGQGDRRR